MNVTRTEIAEDVFGFETTVSLGLAFSLPLRMTVLRDDAGLTLVSPIGIDPKLQAQLSALGEVTTLIAPNRLHTKFLESAQFAFPRAKLIAAPGVAEARPGLRVDQLLSTAEVAEALGATFVEGADRLSEAVLYHRPSQSLVVTDLIFNIRTANLMTRCLLKGVSRAYGKPAQSRLIRSLVSDRRRAARSLEPIYELPVARVIPAHGEVVLGDVQAQLRSSLKWMRGES